MRLAHVVLVRPGAGTAQHAGTSMARLAALAVTLVAELVVADAAVSDDRCEGAQRT